MLSNIYKCIVCDSEIDIVDYSYEYHIKNVDIDHDFDYMYKCSNSKCINHKEAYISIPESIPSFCYKSER